MNYDQEALNKEILFNSRKMYGMHGNIQWHVAQIVGDTICVEAKSSRSGLDTDSIGNNITKSIKDKLPDAKVDIQWVDWKQGDSFGFLINVERKDGRKISPSFTAEYVSPKHPDKMCDRISDAILESFTKQDPNSRVAVETLGGHGKIFIVGEVTSTGNITQSEYENIVAHITGHSTYEVVVHIAQQSPEIAQGVDTGGAGDQGIVIGYACNHNEEMIPQEFYLAKSLCTYLYEKYPVDGKTQITINDRHEITHVVASFQSTKTDQLTADIESWLQDKQTVKDEVILLINPAGEWNIGGFEADAGVTGRKIVIDQYGPRVPVGGGAFSGKDWTKVDRSGAKYAQYIAQQLLQKHNANEVRVELAYAIGIAKPVQQIAYIDSIPHSIEGFDCSMEGIREFINNK